MCQPGISAIKISLRRSRISCSYAGGWLLVEGERIAAIRKLDFVRKYGVEMGSQTQFWSVWYGHSGLAGPDRAIRAKITGFWGGEAASG
jgi:hypothetical protein